jgi:hypothetical protein
MSVGGCEDGGLVAQGAAVGAHEEHLGADLEAAVDYIIKADASGAWSTSIRPLTA